MKLWNKPIYEIRGIAHKMNHISAALLVVALLGVCFAAGSTAGAAATEVGASGAGGGGGAPSAGASGAAGGLRLANLVDVVMNVICITKARPQGSVASPIQEILPSHQQTRTTHHTTHCHRNLMPPPTPAWVSL